MGCDVFIAGLGAMGSAAARACARAGLRVVGCDALEPPHERGSSHGESRIIRAAYFEDPVYAPLARRAFTLWRELERESGRLLLRVTGGLNIGPENGMLVRGALASAREHGIAHELLTRAQAERRFPALALKHADVAVFEPEAGILEPEACITAQLDSARTAGAELHTNEPLVRWHARDGSIEVETAAATYRTKSLILATGAWLPSFRPALPLIVTRQPVFWFNPPRSQDFGPGRLPNYLIEFEPHRIFYGFPDLGAGLKCAIHHEGTPTAPDQVNRSFDVRDYAPVARVLRMYLPAVGEDLARFGVCLYTNTPTGHFIIDQAEPGVWLLSACSGHGFKFAPAIAELLTAAMVDRATIPLVFRTQ